MTTSHRLQEFEVMPSEFQTLMGSQIDGTNGSNNRVGLLFDSAQPACSASVSREKDEEDVGKRCNTQADREEIMTSAQSR